VKNNQVLQKDKNFPKNETFMQLNNEKNRIRKISTTKKRPCHLSLFISNILHANILSFATKMRRKLRQHTGRNCPHTGRHPVKSPKHTQNKKDIFQKGARKKDNKNENPYLICRRRIYEVWCEIG
jgi:hypothetical protein